MGEHKNKLPPREYGRTCRKCGGKYSQGPESTGCPVCPKSPQLQRYYDRKKDPDLDSEAKKYQKKYHLENKIKVIRHYSANTMQCACCSESILEFLTLDHIKAGGCAQRHTAMNHRLAAGTAAYWWLIKNDFPAGFQVLCYNCNMGKRTGDKCPHQKQKEN